MSRRIKRIHVSERIEFSAALPTGHSKSSAFSCAGAKASVPRASILRIAKQPLSTICYASQPMPFSSMRQPSFALGGASRTPILLRFAPAQLSTLPGLRNRSRSCRPVSKVPGLIGPSRACFCKQVRSDGAGRAVRVMLCVQDGAPGLWLSACLRIYISQALSLPPARPIVSQRICSGACRHPLREIVGLSCSS